MTDSRDDEPDLTDGREEGNWRSRYDRRAWIQITLELIYLLALSLAILWAFLIGFVFCCDACVVADQRYVAFLGLCINENTAKWVVVGLSGMLGGITFDLKWLYHSVARFMWNQDRILWRLIVPLNSAVVSLFFAFMIMSGIVPFLKNESFDSLYFGMGFGFLFGYFSDNVLAALQNLAQKVFGTTGPFSRDD